MASNKLRLAVIEGRWWEDYNTSVRSLFDVLSDILIRTPHGYHYEMFNNKDGFRDVVQRIGGKWGFHYLYVAAHGFSDGILGSDGELIQRTVIRNVLRRVCQTEGSKIVGVFFGSCDFITEENAGFLFDPEEGGIPSIKWIAGYSTPVHWLDSFVVDLFFWNKYFRRRNGTDLEKIEHVAKAFTTMMPGAAEKLGFNIYVRRQGPSGGVRPIL